LNREGAVLVTDNTPDLLEHNPYNFFTIPLMFVLVINYAVLSGFPQVRCRGSSSDQPDMVPDGDHSFGDRVGLPGVPDHLHTQLPIVQPVLPSGDVGRERQPPGIGAAVSVAAGQ